MSNNQSPTFSTGNGVAQPLMGIGADIVIQNDGKIVAINQGFFLTRLDSNGVIDMQFGSNGVAVAGLNQNGFTYRSQGVAIQLDGKLLVVGYSINNENYQTELILTRFHENGTLDESFGDSGNLINLISGAYRDVAIQSDGKILISGEQNSGHPLIRLNTDGTLDQAFNVTLNEGFSGRSIEIQGDGKIIVVGGIHNDFGVSRYNSDGSLDAGFGTNGRLSTDFGRFEEAIDVKLQSDGKIVVAGYAFNFSGFSEFAIARYDSDGELDQTFAVDGKLLTSNSNAVNCETLLIQPDGKIVLVAYVNQTFVTSTRELVLIRYNSDGSLDQSFGNAGKVLTPTNAYIDDTSNVNLNAVLQQDGKILVTGTSNSGNGNNVIVARFNTDGSLDDHFNANNSTLGETTLHLYNDVPVILDPNVQIYDGDLSLIGNYGGSSLTISRSGGADIHDIFSAKADGTLASLQTNGSIVVDGITIGTVGNNANGSLVLNFNSNATQALLDSALHQIAYSNNSDLSSQTVALNWTFDDGNSGSQGLGNALSATGTTIIKVLSMSNASATVTSNFLSLSEINAAADTFNSSDSFGQGFENTLSALDNLGGGITYFEPTSNSRVDGYFNNGAGDFTFIGSFSNFPLSVTKAIFYVPVGTVTYSGSLSVNQSGVVSGNLTKFIIEDGISKLTVDAKYNIKTDVLSSISSLKIETDDVSLTIKGNFTEDDGDAGLAGTISSLTLISGGHTFAIAGLAMDYALFDSFDNLSDAIAATLGGNDTVNGTAAAESLFGFGGADSLNGLAGDDTLVGDDGNDTLDGGVGEDSLIGGSGDDTYIVDTLKDGNNVVLQDTIDDSSGIDTLKLRGALTLAAPATLTLANNLENLDASATASTKLNLTGNAAANILTGNAAANTIDGLEGDDSLSGGAGNDALTGGEGNDILDGGLGNDSLEGGVGDDTYIIDAAGDVIVEDADSGTDTVKSSITYTLGTDLENLVLTGKAAINGTGNSLTNSIEGNDGNNILDSGTGADVGDDTLKGGKGNDTYIVQHSDVLVEELLAGGTDLVKSSVDYVLGNNLENLTLNGTTDIDGTGNALANIITGNAGNNQLDGGGGTAVDNLIGGAGDDTYRVDLVSSGAGSKNIVKMKDVITEAAAQGVEDTVKLRGEITLDSAGNAITKASTIVLATTLENLDATGTGSTLLNFTGNNADNDITGNDADNQILGGAGLDRLFGGDGNDTLDGGAGVDTLDGGDGDDTYIVNIQAGDGTTNGLEDVITELGSGNDTLKLIGSLKLTQAISVELNSSEFTEFNNLENLDASATASTKLNLTGNAAANILTGNAAANTIDGLEGDDSLSGGAGNDALTGGEGNDILDGGLGNDSLEGGVGDDTYIIDAAGDVIVEDADSGTDTVKSSITYTLGTDLENLVLTGKAAINGTGNSLTNSIEGNDGNNILDSGTGADVGDDTLKGGKGNDTYIVQHSDVLVEELLAGGTDLVKSSVDYVLGNNLENLTLNGTTDIDGTGNALANIITGNAGNNQLDGGGGTAVDNLIGGAGDDTYRVDLVSSGAGSKNIVKMKDVITEAAAQGVEDTVKLRGEITLDSAGNAITKASTIVLATTLENLDATGTGSTLLNFTGNNADNDITGNDADNQILGGAGLDRLFGGDGNDFLDGGIGNDELYGDIGDDTLIGGTGEDTLYGGAGDDTYVVNITGGTSDESGLEDEFYEYADQGTDTLKVVGSLKLPVHGSLQLDDPEGFTDPEFVIFHNIENLDVSGTGATLLNLIGSTSANILTGNAAINTIDGLDGDDTLFGGAGNDTLSGDDGDDVLDGGTGADLMDGGSGRNTYYVDNINDVVVESADADFDRVYSSLKSYTLAANVESLTLKGTAVTGIGNEEANFIFGTDGANTLFGMGGNDSIDANKGNDIVYGGSGNDSISGDAGNDKLFGDDGNDRLFGGSGNDTLTGGAGADTFVFAFTGAIQSLVGNIDTITDFTTGEDTIELDPSIFESFNNSNFQDGILDQDNFHIGKTALTTSQFILYDNSTGKLYYDADGSGAGKAIQFAVLSKIGGVIPELDAGDFNINFGV